MKLKVNFNMTVRSKRDISVPQGLITAGTKFFLKDAYIENHNGKQALVLGIETEKGVMEALFGNVGNSIGLKKIKTRKQVKAAVFAVLTTKGLNLVNTMNNKN
jgi:hypothetical protein